MASRKTRSFTLSEVTEPTGPRQIFVITYEELQRICDPTSRPRLARVVRWADRIGLTYAYDGRGGIFTTSLALHAVMGIGIAPECATLDPQLFG